MRILLLEDSDLDIILARRFIPEGTELVAVKNRKDFEEVSSTQVFDLVIVDYRIPGWAGLDASEAIRKIHPNMPVLVLSGTITDDMIPTLEEKRIDDVLLKDRPHRLAWAI